MARYIDADKFIAELEQEKTVALEFEDGVAVYEIEHTMNLIGMQPTADVVPKSEVEKLRKENIELSLKNQLLYDEGKNWYDEYQKIKADLKQEKKYKRASEKLADKYYAELQTVFAELDKEYGENCGAYSIDDVTFGEIRRFLAELEKKYTEENKDEN